MRRNVDLNEISDGKLYTSNDMVKADCYECQGCSACCRGMGKSIILDPIDLFHLKQGTGKDFAQLLDHEMELNVVDGMILPNLKMDDDTDACLFLGENERCKIHAFRTGICRLFPLGRLYEEDGFRYFLLTQECRKENRGKVKVKKWCVLSFLFLFPFIVCPHLRGLILLLPRQRSKASSVIFHLSTS